MCQIKLEQSPLPFQKSKNIFHILNQLIISLIADELDILEDFYWGDVAHYPYIVSASDLLTLESRTRPFDFIGLLPVPRIITWTLVN